MARLDGPSRLLAVGVACGAALGIGVIVQRGGVAFALLPAALAWGAGVGALLVAAQAIAQRAGGREVALLSSRAAGLCGVVSGCGAALTSALAGAGVGAAGGLHAERWPALVAVGVAVAANGAWRALRPRTSGGRHGAITAALGLLLAVAAAEAPRHAGVYSLELGHLAVRVDAARWSPSEDCTGINLSAGGKQRPRRIAGYAPPLSLGAATTGNVGSLVTRLLGPPDARVKRRAGIAHFALNGRLVLDDLACYTPAYRRGRLVGQLDLSVRYSGGGDAGGERWAVSCRGVHHARVDITVTLAGVGACQDVRRALARRIVREVRRQATRITGATTTAPNARTSTR